jgi:hypothetical protein
VGGRRIYVDDGFGKGVGEMKRAKPSVTTRVKIVFEILDDCHINEKTSKAAILLLSRRIVEALELKG